MSADALWEEIETRTLERERARLAAEGREQVPVSGTALQGAVDVADLAGDATDTDEPMVIEGLLGPREVIALTGEEGDGKTTLSDQIVRQALRGDQVLDFFDVGELAPRVALFVDTHQEEPEVRRRVREMNRRGLGVERGQLHWWWSGGLDLVSDAADRETVAEQIDRTCADFLWIDAASHMVNDSKDDIEVGAFFDFLSHLMRDRGVTAVGLTLFPRKRPSGEYGRRFDDLFGSREWKGRISRAVYIESRRAVCWKDRGRRLSGLWTQKDRYAEALLDRPGLADAGSVPFIVRKGEIEEAVDEHALRDQALAVAAAHPGAYTKTGLANAMGGRKQNALDAVERLLLEGLVGPNKPHAHLSVLGPTLGGIA